MSICNTSGSYFPRIAYCLQVACAYAWCEHRYRHLNCMLCISYHSAANGRRRRHFPMWKKWKLWHPVKAEPWNILIHNLSGLLSKDRFSDTILTVYVSFRYPHFPSNDTLADNSHITQVQQHDPTSCRQAAATICPAPLLPLRTPKRLAPPSTPKRSSSFPRPIRSQAHRCRCLTR